MFARLGAIVFVGVAITATVIERTSGSSSFRVSSMTVAVMATPTKTTAPSRANILPSMAIAPAQFRLLNIWALPGW